jgi:hypothetical protein
MGQGFPGGSDFDQSSWHPSNFCALLFKLDMQRRQKRTDVAGDLQVGAKLGEGAFRNIKKTHRLAVGIAFITLCDVGRNADTPRLS